jgi:transcriptional regulator with XRE-family HTH domain
MSEIFLTPELCKAARALTGLTQRELATRADVGDQTVADFERAARKPHAANLAKLRTALEAAGVEFIAENGGGAGVRLKGERVTFEQDDRSAHAIDWMDYGRFYAHWRGNRIAVQVQAAAIDDAAGLTKALPQERSRAFQDHLAEFQAYAADFIQQNHMRDGDLVDIDRVHFQQWQERKRIGR